MYTATFLHGLGYDAHSTFHGASRDDFVPLHAGPADKICGRIVIGRVNAIARRAENHYSHTLEEKSQGNGHAIEIAAILERIPNLGADIVQLAGFIVQGAEIPIILDRSLKFPDIDSGTESETIFPSRKPGLAE